MSFYIYYLTVSMINQPHYKIILIGDCRVGKTSFLHYIINNRNHNPGQNVPPTIGVEYAPTKVQVRGQEVKINLWDTCIEFLDSAGAEKYKSITSSYYRKCQGAIVVFDLTDRESFQHLEEWVKELQKKAPSNSKLSIIIVGNKMDLIESGEKERKVPEKEVIDFCMKHSLTFKYTSALTGYNIQQSFMDLVEKIHEESQNNTITHEMASLSWDNNPDTSQLPHDNKQVRLNDDGSSSCPKCC